MRIYFLSFLLILCLWVKHPFAQTSEGIHFSEMVSIDSLRNIVYDLSSDEMGGRKAGSFQNSLAYSYIINKFETRDLLPLKPGYLQPFVSKIPVGTRHYPRRNLFVKNKAFKYYNDFYLPATIEHQKTLKINEVIFLPNNVERWAGDELIKGKAVLLLPGIKSNKDTSIFETASAYYRAASNGAKAVLVPSLQFFNDPNETAQPDFMQLYCFIPPAQRTIPLITVSWKIVQELIGKEKMPQLLEDMKDNTVRYFGVSDRKFKLAWNKTEFYKRMDNLVAFIPGKQLNNLVVIGAHFDHIGIVDNQIYHGADDNASGVAGLLEMARVFSMAAKAGIQPERTIVFVAFNAEEDGLWGSEAFVRSVVYKDSVYAMINMDMIGRNEYRNQKPGVYVLGYDENRAKWKKLLSEVQNEFPDFHLDYRMNGKNDPEHFLERSDQYPFLKEGIPAIFFFDNMRSDYHQPTDSAEKIDYPLLEERVKFIFLTAWKLAYGDDPEFRKYR